jgi:peroxiredoxin
MHDTYADQGLVIVGVNLDNEEDEARKFLEEYPPKFKIAFDSNKEMAREFDIIAMPSSFVIGRDGAIVATHHGFKVKRQDEYEAVIRKALAED